MYVYTVTPNARSALQHRLIYCSDKKINSLKYPQLTSVIDPASCAHDVKHTDRMILIQVYSFQFDETNVDFSRLIRRIFAKLSALSVPRCRYQN